MSALVIDTNVLLVADGQAKHMSDACQIECLERLERVRADEQVVLDDDWRIMSEYRNKLDPNGKPTPGQLFVKWILQSSSRIDWVKITATNAEQTMYLEFPNDEALAAAFDPSDRKFVAAANAHFEKPPILEAADSKWLGWEADLLSHGIRLEILCRGELEAIRKQKLGAV